MTDETMLTDLYQLTMIAAYVDSGKADDMATFDLFVRKLPDGWGYFVAAGLEEAIDYATSMRFDENDLAFLKEKGLFTDAHLEYFRNMRFEGEIAAVPEGAPIGADTPIMRITGKRAQAQLLESRLLNIINPQTMIATKASRIVHAADGASVVDFGMRRAQGEDAAVKGARAAYIGGAVATSNVLAGMTYGIPISGTHAHSFVMSFDSELEAFRAFATTFPDNATLLIDTYDTLQGARNAATVAKELERTGHRLGAVRLDSGDLGTLSKEVRSILDGEGLDYVRIVASNDLNEDKIHDLVAYSRAPIDGYGVGTEMITAKPVAAIPGVYKLVEDESGGKVKLSPGKKTHPCRKQVYRVFEDGAYQHDVMALADERVAGTPLLETVVQDGVRVGPKRSLDDIRAYSLAQVATLPRDVKGKTSRTMEARISPGLERAEEALRAQYAEVYA